MAVQESFMQEDPRAARIAEYLETPLPEVSTWRAWTLDQRRAYLKDPLRVEAEGVRLRDKTCAAEVWMEALDYDDVKGMGRYDAVEINQVLDSLANWERSPKTLRFTEGITGKGFVRITL